MITASLKNYRISPRKVRLVADMIRGKNVILAKTILTNAVKKARHPLHDLLDSAIANAAHNHKIDSADLFVKEIRVDQGFVMKRSMPVSRGSAHPIKKRTSNVSIILDARTAKVAKSEIQKSVKVVKSKLLPKAKKLITNNQ
ncbi:MAG: 50S ribosomal protein L22 [Patescibacteria group bacterium]